MSSSIAISGRSFAKPASAATVPTAVLEKADLRLDKRDDAIKAGAIKPGNVDESELIARIFPTIVKK